MGRDNKSKGTEPWESGTVVPFLRNSTILLGPPESAREGLRR